MEHSQNLAIRGHVRNKSSKCVAPLQILLVACLSAC